MYDWIVYSSKDPCEQPSLITKDGEEALGFSEAFMVTPAMQRAFDNHYSEYRYERSIL